MINYQLFYLAGNNINELIIKANVKSRELTQLGHTVRKMELIKDKSPSLVSGKSSHGVVIHYLWDQKEAEGSSPAKD